MIPTLLNLLCLLVTLVILLKMITLTVKAISISKCYTTFYDFFMFVYLMMSLLSTPPLQLLTWCLSSWAVISALPSNKQTLYHRIRDGHNLGHHRILCFKWYTKYLLVILMDWDTVLGIHWMSLWVQHSAFWDWQINFGLPSLK